jgi:hypothetical protein
MHLFYIDILYINGININLFNEKKNLLKLSKKNNILKLMKKKNYKGHYKKAKYNIGPDGSMILSLPDISEQELIKTLPNVSIITITKNRGMFSSLMLYNWINIKYPREKLEWIILDDSDPNQLYNLSDYIPQDDPYIRYIKLNKSYTISEKRNMGVELSKYDFIVHMDDDDYYFSDHVLAKIRVLLHYNLQGVHSFPIGCYHLFDKTSYIFDKKNNNYDYNQISEASIAYRKSYWLNNKFSSSSGTAEGINFINKNFKKWVNLHFMFNTISITHSLNITGDNRRLITNYNINQSVGDFSTIFPQDFNFILKNLEKLLLSINS